MSGENGGLQEIAQELIREHSLNDELTLSITAPGLDTEDFISKACGMGKIRQEEVYSVASRLTGIPLQGSINAVSDPELAGQIPLAMARKRLLLPLKKSTEGVITLTPELDPAKRRRAVTVLESRLGRSLVRLCTLEDFYRVVENIYSAGEATAKQENLAAGNPASAAEKLLEDAINLSATDIHIEPLPDFYRVRVRVDGRLISYVNHLDNAFAQALIQRLKVLSGLDITENRKPQDGSFVHLRSAGNTRLDIRSATAPTRYGERVTLRLLGLNTANLKLENIGFSPAMYDEVCRITSRPHGLLLIAGPTGSGKSTTLYATLSRLNHPERNLLTVEDPVEYSIPGISQMQIDARSKLTFSSALRSMLRHDPDVLMIGEIRDGETASIALRSSITGHMVFSTIHANTATGAITRLVDMGCEPHMVAAALSGCLSQRLVRRICENCREECLADTADEYISKALGCERYYQGAGCSNCRGEGFLGRTAVFELLSIGEEARTAIRAGASERTCQSYASMYVSLLEDGSLKVRQGLTTPQEILNIVAE